MHSNKQYTIRGIPSNVDRELKKQAKKEGKSLNTYLLETLTGAVGEWEQQVFNDLDELVGKWIEDPQFDSYLEDQSKIDKELWK